MDFTRLMSPIRIRGLELPNKIVMSGMGTHMSYSSEDGKMVTDRLIGYHEARAKGGVGINFTEVCSVDAKSSPIGFLAISDDKYLPGLTRLCDTVHAAGGRMGIQLWQGGLAVGSDPESEIIYPVDLPLTEEFTLPAVSEERILSIIKSYGKAAARAVKAGFDAVEFHCGHNYSPHTFLSPYFNKRTDCWGGSAENCRRYPLEIIREIRRNIPDDMPLFMRIVWQDDFLEGGLTPEDVIGFCKEAGAAGVDVLNVSRGNFSSAALIYETPPVDLANGFNVEAAERIRKETGMLVMPCGRINTPELAESILEKEQADLVVMARAQLADPEFCNKVREGRLSEIKYCIGCDQGCYDRFTAGFADHTIHISCLRNPAVGEEYTKAIVKSEHPKKVLIAGGGIGGIEAADWLRKKGHYPVIFEKTDRLGGQFHLAGQAPRKADFSYACDKAVENVAEQGIEIHLNTTVDAEVIRREQPDAVIIAIGSDPIVPRIPGADLPEVVESHALLAGAAIPDGGSAVVIGGGLVGMETAEYLAARDYEVTVVEMKDSVLGELGDMRKIGTQMSLAAESVTTMLSTTCKAITKGRVTIETEGKESTIPADLVVLAIGSRPKSWDEMKTVCEELSIPYYVIGDAKKAPRLALDTIHEAYDAVLAI